MRLESISKYVHKGRGIRHLLCNKKIEIGFYCLDEVMGLENISI